MDSDTHAAYASLRRQTIAPTGLTRLTAPCAATAPTSTSSPDADADADANGKQTPPSPTTSSDSTSPSSPSLTAACSNRSSTYSDVSKAASDRKRLSLNIPLPHSTAGRTSRPQSWIARTPHILPDPLPSPTSNDFLTSLAAQERRILDLKEELEKAERHLNDLKMNYGKYQAVRKRSDKPGIPQPLKLLSGVLSPTADESDGHTVTQRELERERRRSLMSAPRHSSRTVFSGSHTRQLSLLSPDKTFAPSFPQPDDVLAPTEGPSKPRLLTRSSTVSDVGRHVDLPDDSKYDMTALQREAFVRTSKKMATDFKDGLFTFIEDLRQATIGDEAVNGVQSPSTQTVQPMKTARTNSKKPDDLIDIGGSFWKEHGVEERKSTATTKKVKTPQKQIRKAADDDDESWDTWDTPNDRYETSSGGSSRGSGSGDSSKSALSTPRTSTSSVDAKTEPDGIPWPALDQLSPKNLRKTATHLMREWEKSLTPPAGDAREHPHTGDYMSRHTASTTPTMKKT